MARFRLPCLSFVFTACFLSSLGVSTGKAQETKLAALLQRSPAAANAISYLHVPSFKKVMSDAGVSLDLSDDLEEVWLISDLDTAELRPNWEAGYATTKAQFKPEDLASSLGGYIDTVGDKKVIWTPRQSYLVPIGDGALGFLRPARRSLLAKWIDSSNNTQAAPYLLKQAAQPEQYLSFMLALNLDNVFSQVEAAYRVANFETVGEANAESIGKLLASVSGISIIVGRNSLKECIVSFEFGESPAALAPMAPKLLNEILNRNGTAMPEVLDWKPSVDGNKLSLQGSIGGDSLDSILGLFSIRGHAEHVSQTATKTEAAPTPGAEPGESQIVEYSKEYFDKVQAYIERIRKYEAQSTGYRAKWNEQQARRIDELPTLYVDTDMIAYGADVANAFRNNATSIRTGNVKAGQMQAAQGENYGYDYYGGYTGGFYGSYYGGYVGRSANAAQRTAMVTGAQQRMAGYGSYQQVIAAVDQMTANIRRAMTEKYKVQF